MFSNRPVSRSKAARLMMGAACAALVATATVAVPAAQADDISWGINPGGDEDRSSFSYELDPGDSVEDSFQITNYGVNPLELSVYGADGQTSANGALELLPASEPSQNIGAWLKADESTVTLAAGEETEVDFTLSIPEDAQPGDYVGGMISSYIDSSSGAAVAVDQRLATQLAVRVGGEGTMALGMDNVDLSAPIAWNPFAPVSADFAAQVTNDGTLRARGNYTVKISGLFGLGSSTQTIALEEMLPGATVDLASQVPGLWPLIWQQYEVTLTPEGIDSVPGEPVVVNGTFWTFPAGWVGILLLIIIAVVIVAVVRSRRYEYVYEDEDDEADDAKPTASASRE
ncbi:WxL protein peptidoglycan domain-containing protein [Glutamicibacter sp. NPDC087344]|uniref:WxL protein peptidoglycan domain-containing protein n=1 Tax=Glutamicibacter sp. NPDC087344 TaxID=3363994 RepID=UPI0037F47642